MPSTEDRPKESAVNKISWIIVGAVVTAFAAIPIAYYIVGPFTPKAHVISSIAMQVLRGNDNKFVMLFRITNTDSRLTAKDVLVHFKFKRNRITSFGEPDTADVAFKGDRRLHYANRVHTLRRWRA
jgi:hypothetical protein